MLYEVITVVGTPFPESGFRAANAAVAGFDGPTGAIVVADRWAVVVGDWPFAAHFIKAPTFLVPFISPCFHEFASIEVAASFAVIVDASAIGKQRSVSFIHGR